MLKGRDYLAEHLAECLSGLVAYAIFNEDERVVGVGREDFGVNAKWKPLRSGCQEQA